MWGGFKGSANQVTPGIGCHSSQLVRYWSPKLAIISMDREMSLTAWSVCWERAVSMLPAQNALPPMDPYVRRVCVGGFYLKKDCYLR